VCSRTLFWLRLQSSVVSWTSMSIKRSADSARKADTIQKTVLIQAAPAFIFRALTEAKEITQWFCDRVTSDPRVGGELKAFWRMGNGGQAWRGRAIFTTLVPDSQVELQWIDEGDGQCPEGEHHTTTYSIRLKRGISEVTVCDAGPPLEDGETLTLLDEGWIGILRDLKEHCESKQRSSRHRSFEESGWD
jgi:uncharacterized protein YndB with AHSA1/START domain